MFIFKKNVDFNLQIQPVSASVARAWEQKAAAAGTRCTTVHPFNGDPDCRRGDDETNHTHHAVHRLNIADVFGIFPGLSTKLEAL